MAEPSKCPFCNFGTVIWVSNDDLYFLACTHCQASGRYSAEQGKLTVDGESWLQTITQPNKQNVADL